MTKYLISLLAVATSVAACATAVESANTFGVLKVPATEKDTIISVPWVDLGASDGQITVTNLVLASNMKARASLRYWSSAGQYKAWTIMNPAGEAEESSTSAYWDPVTVSGPGEDDEVPLTSLPRGAAIIVHQDTLMPIYLYGQYLSTPASVTVSEGESTAPVYTLIAPSVTTNVNLNAVSRTGAPNIKDTIIIDGQTTLSYNSTYGWGQVTLNASGVPDGLDTTKAIIPAGKGVWYKSRGGSPTFNW